MFSACISLMAYIVLKERSVLIQGLNGIYYEFFSWCPLCTNKLAVLAASKHVRNVSWVL